MNYYLGIDPGASSGAIALISGDLSDIHSVRHPKDVAVCSDIIRNWDNMSYETEVGRGHGISLAVLEKVHSMPGQGVASMFKFGADFGMWRGILAALQIPYILVTPTVWQRGVMDNTNKGDKTVTLEFCRRRFPKHELKYKADNGRADAICMAMYAKKKHEGQL